MKPLIFAAIGIAIFSCSDTKKIAGSVTGFTTLYNYLLNPGVSFNNAVNYVFIGNTSDFHRTFYMTKASPGTATVPDFNSQSVIAIILEPTEKVINLSIDKAVIKKNNLNISYSVTDTTSWKSFLHMPMVVATVSKSVDVKQVTFTKNGVEEKTIAAKY